MTEATIRESVLLQAIEVVTKDRNTAYGGPEENFTRIAAYWTTYLADHKGPMMPHDVAVMMTLVKIARIATSPQNIDHWLDGCGYLSCGAEVRP